MCFEAEGLADSPLLPPITPKTFTFFQLFFVNSDFYKKIQRKIQQQQFYLNLLLHEHLNLDLLDINTNIFTNFLTQIFIQISIRTQH